MTMNWARFAAWIQANLFPPSKIWIEPLTLDNIHLTQAAKDFLGEPDILRVRAIKARRWIFYPRAKQALDRLNLLLDHPRGTRMPSIAIYGDSGMGKTMIMEKFCDNNPASFDPTTGVQTMPVLAIEMSGKPGERRLYAEILAALGAPQAPRADIVQMEQAALRLLKTVGVQVLVIDEIHNILAGSYREQRVVLNTLRFLSNRLQISLVCFGVTEAREAISGDVQLARRFSELTLNRWAANEQFEALVSSILRNMPLRRPTVLTPKSLRRILQISGGITANIFQAITSLAADSIESGIEHITDEAVESWSPPVGAETAYA
nr:TniB family NTP-binding protein [Mesorhizobium sp. WSM4875]